MILNNLVLELQSVAHVCVVMCARKRVHVNFVLVVLIVLLEMLFHVCSELLFF